MRSIIWSKSLRVSWFQPCSGCCDILSFANASFFEAGAAFFTSLSSSFVLGPWTFGPFCTTQCNETQVTKCITFQWYQECIASVVHCDFLASFSVAFFTRSKPLSMATCSLNRSSAAAAAFRLLPSLMTPACRLSCTLSCAWNSQISITPCNSSAKCQAGTGTCRIFHNLDVRDAQLIWGCSTFLWRGSLTEVRYMQSWLLDKKRVQNCLYPCFQMRTNGCALRTTDAMFDRFGLPGVCAWKLSLHPALRPPRRKEPWQPKQWQ